MKATILAQNEMIVRAGEQDLAGGGMMPLGNQSHVPVRLFGKPLSQARGKCRINVLHDDDRNFQRGRDLGENLGQGVGTTG